MMITYYARSSLLQVILILVIPLVIVLVSTQGELAMKHVFFLVSTKIIKTFASASLSPKEALHLTYNPDHAEEHIQEFFHNSQLILCRDLRERNDVSHVPLRVRYSFHCQDLHDHSNFSTGKWLLFVYNLRRAASLIGYVELQMECIDAADTKHNLILPWAMGTFEAQTAWDINREVACKPVWFLEGSTLEDLRNDLRRMALSLVGVSAHSSATNIDRQLQTGVVSSSPLVPEVEVDDVAVHFRCGDILEKTPHLNYGYARFAPLADLISDAASSIGIVIQDFQDEKSRCAILVYALQLYLQKRFPQARVNVRGPPSESIALQYARFILAQQVLTAGTYAYMTMPFSATFGTISKVDQKQIVDSIRIFDLWQEENGREKVLDVLISSESN
ncbi:hypothetical protein FisN_23Hh045 [Fistulifera solaris]|uniref:Uncharacterized protein n=1 Tax=Fistulifera solaris TaxID=1519565 RepID=A0A1Z5KMH5_FISSO|nr:hypothetical protein FisN_23Hh045 [Fistulifera solaris]|eukprot:GAX27489.1 hypothetical protein FisN_23Hh045 [Fistulifera solaris]